MSAIGIDFGSICCNTTIFTNGQEITLEPVPSYVFYPPGSDEFIGDVAKEERDKNPDSKHIVFGLKHLIGRNLTDIDKDAFPFNLVDENGEVKIKIPDVNNSISPKETIVRVLKYLKGKVQSHLSPDSVVVLSLHASFTVVQRTAMIDAIGEAGFIVDAGVHTIRESIAAALAYGSEDRAEDQSQNVLFVDFGGGFLDVSLINMKLGSDASEPDQYEIKKQATKPNLGGIKFTNRLFDHYRELWKNEFAQEPDAELEAALRKACNKAKQDLSDSTVVTLDPTPENPLSQNQRTLTLEKFNEVCQELFNDVEAILREFSQETVDRVVLVGGAARMQRVSELIDNILPNKLLKVNTNWNPEQAVARGAAIFAETKMGTTGSVSPVVEELVLCSLGIETRGGFMEKIIEKDTPIKQAVMSKMFTTVSDNQTSVSIQVFEGELDMTEENQYLDKFTVSGIPRALRGGPRIKVAFHVLEPGTLEASAIVEGANIPKKVLHVKPKPKRMATKPAAARSIAMNALEDYINIVRGDPRFKDAAGNVSTWLSENKKNSSVKADDFINKQESLRTTVNGILARAA